MRPPHVQIAIAGAGIAGLAAAVALSRSGVRCEVFEQTRVLGEVGAGVQLAPNAARLLHRLGLGPHLRATAVRPQAIEMRRWDDDTVLGRTPLGGECEERFGAPYYTMHRADLHRGLLSLLPEGTLHLGYRLTGIDEGPQQVALHFEGGSSVTADVVAGADGIHSVVRELLVTDQPQFSGQSIYRGLVPVSRVPGLVEEPKVVLWLGPGQHCVSYPIHDGMLVSLGATAPAESWRTESWSAEGNTEDLAASYAQWNEQVRQLTRAPDTVSRWALYDRDIIDRWSSRRVTLIGDAAHPMLPFMAQGANQAVEDGVALAACLRDAPPKSYSTSLQRYEQVRRGRTNELHRISRENTTALHLSDGAQQRRRDAALAANTGLAKQEWIYAYDAERVATARDV